MRNYLPCGYPFAVPEQFIVSRKRSAVEKHGFVPVDLFDLRSENRLLRIYRFHSRRNVEIRNDVFARVYFVLRADKFAQSCVFMRRKNDFIFAFADFYIVSRYRRFRADGHINPLGISFTFEYGIAGNFVSILSRSFNLVRRARKQNSRPVTFDSYRRFAVFRNNFRPFVVFAVVYNRSAGDGNFHFCKRFVVLI